MVAGFLFDFEADNKQQAVLSELTLEEHKDGAHLSHVETASMGSRAGGAALLAGGQGGLPRQLTVQQSCPCLLHNHLHMQHSTVQHGFAAL